MWCIFSVANNYDQPPNNLVIAYEDKPDASILSILLTRASEEDIELILKEEEVRIGDTYYGLREIQFGQEL